MIRHTLINKEDTMSDNSSNPYESPQTEAGSVKPLGGRFLTENMVFYLKSASPWLRFVGIAGFISLGLMAVQFITLIIVFQTSISSIPGMGFLGSSFFLFTLLILEVLLFFPTFFIFQFGRKIRAYLHSGEEADLEQAFKNNKSLWKYMGVLAILSLGSTGIFVLSSILTVIASAML
jgi:hypothetical protein